MKCRLINNTQYIHSVTKAYFWYLNDTFITINEYTGSVEVYTEDEMGSNINHLIEPEDKLELETEEDNAETIQYKGENNSSDD